jgi:hypothetical protein
MPPLPIVLPLPALPPVEVEPAVPAVLLSLVFRHLVGKE